MPKKPTPPKKKKTSVVNNSLTDAVMGFQPYQGGTQLSQTDTLFKNMRGYMVSNMRVLLSQAYVEHGLIQTIVDVPVDDAMRGGVTCKTKQLSEDELEALHVYMEREDILNSKIGRGMKWQRLFGGGAVLIITDQDPESPLDMSAIHEDTPLDFKAVDMWELYWDQQSTEDHNLTTDALEDVEVYNYYGNKVHHSRVLKMKGFEAPSFIRPRLRGWGLSVVEALVRSINQYLKSNNLSFEVLDEFKLDIFQLKGLSQTLMTLDGTSAVHKRMSLLSHGKNYQNAMVMDSDDKYEQKTLSFAGIAEVMKEIRMQIASDMRMPLTKVFGISSAGFSSGEDDIENYNSMVESSIRSKAKYDILRIVEVICQKLFGHVPDDLQIEFKPLRVLSSEQEETVKTQKFARLIQAKQAGEMTTQEFKEACNKDNLLPVQLDTSIETITPTGQEIGDPDGIDDGASTERDRARKSLAPEAKQPKDIPTQKKSSKE